MSTSAASASAARVKIAKVKDETPAERALRRAERKRYVDRERKKVLASLENEKKKAPKRDVVQPDFVCPVRYINDLPDVPVEQRFISFPFDDDFVTAFDMLHGVSSETAKPRIFHADPDLGIGIPLMDPAQYTIPSDGAAPQLSAVDAFITSEEFSKPAAKKTEVVDPNKVEWVLLSQHLHNDLYDAVYKQGDQVRVQTQDFARRKEKFKAQLGPGDKRSRIEASFAACAGDAPLVHPSQPSLQPKRVWELLPDPDRSGVNYVAAAFDIDPDDAPERKARKLPPLTAGQRRARLERSIVRTPAAQPVNSRDNSTMVHFLLPEVEDVDPALHGAGRAVDPVHTRPIRDYAMLVERVDPRGGEEGQVWAWDNANAVVTYAPVRARAQMTSVRDADADAVSVVAVHRRAVTADEEDAAAEARALLDEVDPRAAVEAIEERRRERADREADASSSSALMHGMRPTGPGTVTGAGAESSGGGGVQDRGGDRGSGGGRARTIAGGPRIDEEDDDLSDGF